MGKWSDRARELQGQACTDTTDSTDIPTNEGSKPPQKGAFVPFVGGSRGSHIFQPGDRVSYRVPKIYGAGATQYRWENHCGEILAVSAFAEMVLIAPETEPGTDWRWLWWGYAKREDRTP